MSQSEAELALWEGLIRGLRAVDRDGLLRERPERIADRLAIALAIELKRRHMAVVPEGSVKPKEVPPPFRRPDPGIAEPDPFANEPPLAAAPAPVPAKKGKG